MIDKESCASDLPVPNLPQVDDGNTVGDAALGLFGDSVFYRDLSNTPHRVPRTDLNEAWNMSPARTDKTGRGAPSTKRRRRNGLQRVTFSALCASL
jgi:hypothetical protein